MRDHPVIEALAKLTRKRAEEIDSAHSLRQLGLSSSFGLSALRSLVEAASRTTLPALEIGMTVGQVIALASAREVAAPPAVQSEAPPSPVSSRAGRDAALSKIPLDTAVGVGIDMQEIASFEAVADFRIDPFYAAHFDASEIATAALKPDPRAHFCGIFCAKEAAKKSDPRLLDLRMSAFLVRHDDAGRPWLELADPASREDFLFQISITHTAHAAAAVCLTFRRPA